MINNSQNIKRLNLYNQLKPGIENKKKQRLIDYSVSKNLAPTLTLFNPAKNAYFTQILNYHLENNLSLHSQINLDSLPKKIKGFTLECDSQNQVILKHGKISYLSKIEEPYFTYKHQDNYEIKIGLSAWKDYESPDRTKYFEINSQYKDICKLQKQNPKNYQELQQEKNKLRQERGELYMKLNRDYENLDKFIDQSLINQTVEKLLSRIDFEYRHPPKHMISGISFHLSGNDLTQHLAVADRESQTINILCGEFKNFSEKFQEYRNLEDFELSSFDPQLSNNCPYYFAHELSHLKEDDCKDTIPWFGKGGRYYGNQETWLEHIEKIENCEEEKSEFMIAAFKDWKYRQENSDQDEINSKLTIGNSFYGEKSPNEAFAEILPSFWMSRSDSENNYPNLTAYYQKRNMI